MTVRLAVFDCDGTLSDGQAAVCEAMEAAFASAGLAMPDPYLVRRTVGLSLPYAVRQIAPDAAEHEHALVVEAYKQAFRRSRSEGTLVEPLYEGVAELLGRLKAGGWLLGVATGKSDRGLALCLDHHGIGRHFVTLQTADRHPSKPHPSMIQQAMAEAGAAPETTMMIGDTAYDIGMARAAGVTAVGVAWGYHDETELFAEGAHHVARVPRDIVTIARGLP